MGKYDCMGQQFKRYNEVEQILEEAEEKKKKLKTKLEEILSSDEEIKSISRDSMAFSHELPVNEEALRILKSQGWKGKSIHSLHDAELKEGKIIVPEEGLIYDGKKVKVGKKELSDSDKAKLNGFLKGHKERLFKRRMIDYMKREGRVAFGGRNLGWDVFCLSNFNRRVKPEINQLVTEVSRDSIWDRGKNYEAGIVVKYNGKGVGLLNDATYKKDLRGKLTTLSAHLHKVLAGWPEERLMETLGARRKMGIDIELPERKLKGIRNKIKKIDEPVETLKKYKDDLRAGGVPLKDRLISELEDKATEVNEISKSIKEKDGLPRKLELQLELFGNPSIKSYGERYEGRSWKVRHLLGRLDSPYRAEIVEVEYKEGVDCMGVDLEGNVFEAESPDLKFQNREGEKRWLNLPNKKGSSHTPPPDAPFIYLGPDRNQREIGNTTPTIKEPIEDQYIFRVNGNVQSPVLK